MSNDSTHKETEKKKEKNNHVPDTKKVVVEPAKRLVRDRSMWVLEMDTITSDDTKLQWRENKLKAVSDTVWVCLKAMITEKTIKEERTNKKYSNDNYSYSCVALNTYQCPSRTRTRSIPTSPRGWCLESG